MSFIDYAKSLPLSEQLKPITQALQDQQTTKYFSGELPQSQHHRYYKQRSVSSTVVMLYDIMITINQEVNHIWKARWSFGKILFFFARYPVAVDGVLWSVRALDVNASEPFCVFEGYLSVWAIFIFLIPLQAVVFLRTIAIWDRKRSVVILLGIALFTMDAVMLATLSYVTSSFTFKLDERFRPIIGCNSGLLTLNPRKSIPAWPAVIAFDTTIFLLTLVKGVKSYKNERSSLITVLFRDGFVYYAVMLVLAVSNLALLAGLPTERIGLSNTLTPVLRASYSVIGSRLLLNIREAAAHNMIGTNGNEISRNMRPRGPPTFIHSSNTADSSTLNTLPEPEVLDIFDPHRRREASYNQLRDMKDGMELPVANSLA